MPTYLQLAYEGNFAGRVNWIAAPFFVTPMELFTYQGTAYVADYFTGEVYKY